jgi:short-subunit dehydrogenase involved in D-alanine esterification of teichoic acids
MTKKLEGKTAAITGGTEGLGSLLQSFLSKEGAYVFITGRREKELDEPVKAIGTNVTGVQGDVAKLDDLDRLYDTVSKVKGESILFSPTPAFSNLSPSVPSPKSISTSCSTSM